MKLAKHEPETELATMISVRVTALTSLSDGV